MLRTITPFDMIDSLGMTDNPAAELAQLKDGQCVVLSFNLPQYWLPESPVITLYAVCLAHGAELLCVISDNAVPILQASDLERVDQATLEQLAHDAAATVIDLRQPLPLDTVRIEKPWGAEIWYTGVEKRGVCRVGNTPLPWVVALAGELVCGGAPPQLILVKILDPFPDAIYGDLYFEMHEQKIEVYVVTNVDESAWPDGVGAIRFGFAAEQLGQFASLEAFKTAWLDSVNAYRQVRVSIDEAFDEFRRSEGIDVGELIPPAVAEQWKLRLEDALIAQEHRYREAMNAFTALEPLRPGDVVRVPPFTPHSLQHGVRVVEFQTPHYERYILSFAQKVLTQPHWDTAEAIDKIDWEACFDTTLENLEERTGYRVDQVADFDAFEVRRIHLEPGAHYRLALSTYVIAMAVESAIRVCSAELAPEQACLVPAAVSTIDITPAGDTACLTLLAIPRPP